MEKGMEKGTRLASPFPSPKTPAAVHERRSTSRCIPPKSAHRQRTASRHSYGYVGSAGRRFDGPLNRESSSPSSLNSDSRGSNWSVSLVQSIRLQAISVRFQPLGFSSSRKARSLRRRQMPVECEAMPPPAIAPWAGGRGHGGALAKSSGVEWYSLNIRGGGGRSAIFLLLVCYFSLTPLTLTSAYRKPCTRT